MNVKQTPGKITKGTIKIFLNNINGFASKQTSLLNIINQERPTFVCLVETKVRRLKSYVIKGYKDIVTRNVKKGKGGMLVAVRNNTASSVKETTFGCNQNILAVEVAFGKLVFRVILCYGPQEEYSVDERNEFYDDLAIEIENSFMNNSIPMIMGDFNAKIELIDNEITAITNNGQLLLNVLNKYELSVCNFHPEAEGYYTRISKKKGKQEKSLLDYVVTTESAFEYLSEFITDEDKIMTPFRTIKLKKGIRAVYSDHCSISASFNIPHEISKEAPVKRWIINQPGLEKFTELTEPPFMEVEDVGVDMNYNRCINKIKEVMGKCFKEKTLKINNNDELDVNDNRISKIVKQLKQYRKKGKSQRITANIYIQKVKDLILEKVNQENMKKVQDAYVKLSEDGKFSSNLFWKLCKSVCGKQRDNKTSVIINETTEIFGEGAIINAYKEEFSYRLRNRKIEDGLEDYQESLELLVSLYLENAEAVKAQYNFTMDELIEIIKNLANKKAPGLDGITTELLKAAGDGLLQAVLDLFNYMKNNVVVPHQWEQVVITTIYKGKGKKKELVNYRGIFLTSVLCKIFEKLIQKRIDVVLNTVSKFQAGGRKRSTVDQLFLLRGALDHMAYLKKPAYITLYDYRQAFDSLWLKESILSLWNLGIRDVYLPLIYKLNEKAVVTVNTPYGRTSPFVVDQIVKQGDVLASNICSVSTGEICDQDFGAPIGLLSLRPLAFVDDILKLNTKTDDVRSSHAHTLSFSKLKKLDLNEPKCCGLTVGGKKNTNFPELYINDILVQIVKSAKYLGDIINNKNNNEDMLIERGNKAIGKLISIFAAVNEVTLGAFLYNALLLMYHSYYLAAIIFNCQSWTNISNKDITKLQTLQLKYLKKMIRVPQATANCFVFLETGILPIEHEIWRRQFTYLHSILNLDSDDPVRTMYDQQKKLPGERNWANNMEKLRLRYSISFDDRIE